MPDNPLDEARECIRLYAHATRTVNNTKQRLMELWPEVGNIDAHGMWMGGRQGFNEAYKPTILLQALINVATERGFPLVDELFAQLDRHAMKRLAEHPEWKDYIVTEIKRLDPEDEGLTLHWGGVNFSPVKTRPSDEKYRVLERGDEPHPEGYEDAGELTDEPLEEAEEESVL